MENAIILAGGLGKRMNSEKPKVLLEVLGKPMLSWVTDACVNANAAALILRRELERSRGNLWDALGAYHSRTAHLHYADRQRLQRNLKKLEQGRVAALIEYVNGTRRAW